MNKELNPSDNKCPLCDSGISKSYFYPPTTFNNKVFHYYECQNCGCSFVNPFPDKNDFDLIYGEDDHAYLKKLGEDEMHIYNFDIPPYNHQRFQIDFFSKYKYWEKAGSLLDIGCGSGFYMKSAMRSGIHATGIEYNENFTKLLRKKTGLSIFSFNEFEKNNDGKKFDLIHFGHILEHLIRPEDMLNWAKKYAHENTLIIVDGPLEKNKCLSQMVISTGSKIKKNKMNYYAPQHISFTDHRSQLRFFEKCGLEKVNYQITEQLFPLPSKPDYRSVKNLLLFLTARMSVTLSKLNSRWGNVFHYAGKFRT